ncbi:hypothetical protein [Magnetospirillum sp. SS-4]|uniref:hypothetical protein n=1 Tax=Magnetospirillum sp. SS-4 TaxID=2681465 RepID=UPI00137C9189|nr:hypothetical protein [Magnetospirillum sp. SS-4]CAA7615970.1 conserved hypothetical protein [Magnetospirillum sp. SS-4]
MGKPVTAEEQEALFQSIIRKLPLLDDSAQLREVAALAVALMLRRPGDAVLREELTRQVNEAVDAVRPGQSPEITRNEMRSAARACIRVLQAAKERRLPRHLQPGSREWAQAEGGAPAGPAHPPSPPPAGGIKVSTTRVVVGIAVAALVFGGYAWWSGSRSTGDEPVEVAEFTRQVMEAAKGGGPASHAFGGSLKMISLGGRPVVVADGVPPRVCVASGWALVKAGVLSINGITPNRISAGKITELCNSETGNASIMWTPK